MLDDISLSILQKTKLEEKQARVYLAALQLGMATVAEISDAAELKRPITYVVLDELQQLGYVNEVPGHAKKMYTATDPNALLTELERTVGDFKDMLPYLRSKQRKAGKPYVTYFSGKTGARRAFQQIRRPQEARYAVSVQDAMRFIPDEVERWKSTYAKDKARVGGKHLLLNSPEDKEYGTVLAAHGQQVRYLPQGKLLDMDLALIDGAVFLTAFEDDIHVTVIESPPLYHSLCTFFDIAWDAAQKD